MTTHIHLKGEEEVVTLVATVGMADENALLRRLFPKNYWQSQEALPYDFMENSKRLQDLVTAYIEGEKLDTNNELLEKVKKMNAEILEAFEEEGIEVVSRPPTRQMFADALVRFFGKGMEMQRNGQNPSIYIHW